MSDKICLQAHTQTTSNLYGIFSWYLCTKYIISLCSKHFIRLYVFDFIRFGPVRSHAVGPDRRDKSNLSSCPSPIPLQEAAMDRDENHFQQRRRQLFEESRSCTFRPEIRGCPDLVKRTAAGMRCIREFRCREALLSGNCPSPKPDWRWQN